MTNVVPFEVLFTILGGMALWFVACFIIAHRRHVDTEGFSISVVVGCCLAVASWGLSILPGLHGWWPAVPSAIIMIISLGVSLTKQESRENRH